MSEENAKMHKNYDVLKEHELNIIRDIEARKMADQKEMDAQVRALKDEVDKRDQIIKERETANQILEDRIRRMEFEAEKQAKIKKDMEDSGLLQATQIR